MKISVVTPSVRVEMLPIVGKCLERQTIENFEWLVGSPTNYGFGKWVKEPIAKKGDYYGLNRCWNEIFRQSRGELIISIVDGLWFPPETLERLWQHYKADSMKCIGLIGHQYDQIIFDKPEHMVWKDPRMRDNVQFYQILPYDLELCIASLPRKGIFEVGGVDEEFDKFAAWSEKELCCRMEKLGYTFWIDQSIEYRAIYHPRLNKDWDEKYRQSTEYFQQCYKEIQQGKRLRLDFLGKNVIKELNGIPSEKEEPAKT